MKIIFRISILVFSSFIMGSCATFTSDTIPDGLYLVERIDTVESDYKKIAHNENALSFSSLFDEFTDHSYRRIIIKTDDYVPLELEKPPIAEQQTDKKKKLLLTLTNDASEYLIKFTSQHIMKSVVLVKDNEVLTMHTIKTPITSGQLQITRCHDNACELLYSRLKNNQKNN